MQDNKTIFSETFKALLKYMALDSATLKGYFGNDVSEETVRIWTVRKAPTTKNFKELKSALNAFYNASESKYLDVITDGGKLGAFYAALEPIWSQFGDVPVPEAASYKGFIDNINDLLDVAFKLSKGKDAKRRVNAVKKPEKKLVAFNVDGTLIKGFRYSWTVLWEAIGSTAAEAVRLKQDFELGKLSYIDWIKDDCRVLKSGGLTMDKVKSALEKDGCHLTGNLVKAVEKLKDHGCIVVIISGGTDCVLKALLPEADKLFDKIFMNEFVFDKKSGLLEDIIPTDYDWDRHAVGVSGKEAALKMLAEKYGVKLENTAFIGNDFNDLGAMEIAGMKIMSYGNDKCDFARGINKRPDIRKLPPDTIFEFGDDLMHIADRIIKWQFTDDDVL